MYRYRAASIFHSSISTLFRRPVIAGKIIGGIDEANVAERLREVSHLALRPGVIFLRQQPHVVAKCQQTLEHRARLGDTALENQVVNKPEAASDECSLAGRQSIFRFPTVVTEDDPVNQKPLFNCMQSSNNTSIGRRQKADNWKKQEACI